MTRPHAHVVAARNADRKLVDLLIEAGWPPQEEK